MNKIIEPKAKAYKKVVEQIKRIAPTKATVILLGETGTGKTMLAEMIHEYSPRNRNGRMRKVNLGAIVRGMEQKEFYGVKAKYATGIEDTPGIFLEANRSTLFLDELHNMSDDLQKMFLGKYEDQYFSPLGAIRNENPVCLPYKEVQKKYFKSSKKNGKDIDIINLPNSNFIDIRYIFASNYSEESLKAKIRPDLYHRIREYVIIFPPLRNYIKEVIDTFPNDILKKPNVKKLREDGFKYREKPIPKFKEIKGFTSKAKEKLASYNWPGNVRELEQTIKAAIIKSLDYHDKELVESDWIEFTPMDSESNKNMLIKEEVNDIASDEIETFWDRPFKEAENLFKQKYFDRHYKRLMNIKEVQAVTKANFRTISKFLETTQQKHNVIR